MKNIDITPKELAQIRALADFDLTMLLSDIHDCGWPAAKTTLRAIMEAMQKGAVVPHVMSKSKRARLLNYVRPSKKAKPAPSGKSS